MPACSGDGELIIGSRCPIDSSPLEYNGNYWCSNPSCRYIMPTDRMSKKDKFAFNVAYILLMEQRNETPSLDAIYQDVLSSKEQGG